MFSKAKSVSEGAEDDSVRFVEELLACNAEDADS
jgi:hypothetical protein